MEDDNILPYHALAQTEYEIMPYNWETVIFWFEIAGYKIDGPNHMALHWFVKNPYNCTKVHSATEIYNIAIEAYRSYYYGN